MPESSSFSWRCESRCPQCGERCTIDRSWHDERKYHEHRCRDPTGRYYEEEPHKWSLGLRWEEVHEDSQWRGLFEGPSGNPDPAEKKKEEEARDRIKQRDEEARQERREEEPQDTEMTE